MSAYVIREFCAACEGEVLEPVLQLPDTPLANEFVTADKLDVVQETFPLALLLCHNCGHLQLQALVDPKRIFENYVYVTGTSPVTRVHLAKYADDVIKLVPSTSFVVEIGSNDGTLLAEFKKRGARALGVDPAKEIAKQATASGIPTLDTFFTSKLAWDIFAEEGAADVVIANNVLAHATDIEDIVTGARVLLGSTGVFVFEVSHALDIVEYGMFDTIYHEHYSYHTVEALVTMFRRLGLTIFRVERNAGQLGRGSLRCYARLAAIPDDSVAAVIAMERHSGMRERSTYHDLQARITKTGAALRERLQGHRDEGVSIMGYGAPAKLTTLMYAFDLGKGLVSHIVDDSSWKWGLYTPGKHIPVTRPTPDLAGDICVVFAWNFAQSIIDKCRSAGWHSAFFIPFWAPDAQ